MKLCKLCDREVHAKGFCMKHYHKWLRVGKDDSLMLVHGNEIPIEQRMQDFSIDEDGCHLWNKGLSYQGYGKVKYQGRTLPAHVVSYYLSIGTWPDTDLDHVCHTLNETCQGGSECKHRRCINPEHLEPVGAQENTRRRDIRLGLDQRTRSVIQKDSRVLPTHCGKGHEYTEENTRITTKGHRSCRTCAREYTREYRKR